MKKFNEITKSAAESIELMLAPDGFRTDKVYGQVAVRQALSKKTIDEVIFVTMRHMRQLKVASINFMTEFKKMVEFDIGQLQRGLKWYHFGKKEKIKELTRTRELLNEMINKYNFNPGESVNSGSEQL